MHAGLCRPDTCCWRCHAAPHSDDCGHPVRCQIGRLQLSLLCTRSVHGPAAHVQSGLTGELIMVLLLQSRLRVAPSAAAGCTVYTRYVLHSVQQQLQSEVSMLMDTGHFLAACCQFKAY